MSDRTGEPQGSGWDHARAGCDLGGISIDRVVDMERLAYPHSMLLPTSDADELRRLSAEMGSRIIDPETLAVALSFHSYLVRTANHTILVDTCCGNDKERPQRVDWHRRDGGYLNNLRARGIEPEDIDIVMCTHLHADHVGWNTRLVDGGWVPTFPNAEYLFAETEYNFWMAQQARSDERLMHGSYDDSVLPVMESGQAKLVASDYEIETGICFEPAVGHTPGTIVLNVEGGSSHAMVCGDVMHHPAQVVHPEWSSGFCSDPVQSARTRRDLLSRLAGTGTLVLPAHFMSPYYGSVERDGDGFRTII
ncbi:MAG: MBL fold metallo-hydrolase [Rhodospirillaceae bacterium]|jgi:glyoxylase-like metal-dependent hydrolase (beta-lactamase superfamily II)|nr:MBL fold metallo-hydrolase [Rhodospirillaceae bacterium]MBT5459095.1 MBL fold metallo-hydrolase [Rhodospirillaceae bacterium]